MAWCGVAWRGVAWCGVVWCGVWLGGVVWCGGGGGGADLSVRRVCLSIRADDACTEFGCQVT